MNKILEIQNLRVYFPVPKEHILAKKSYLKAVDNVSLVLEKGKTLGLVGESGCGKTTLGKTLLGLHPQATGNIFYYSNNKAKEILSLEKKELQAMRPKVQIIFQDPYSSLNPRMTVLDILAEGLIIHNRAKNRKEREKIIHELLDKVGLPKSASNKYPHEFSGGQRQRIGIARALALKPEFIVCDEAVSALDVSVQAQILNLLSDLQKEFNLSYLFISHDLSVVKHIAHQVAVMYLGKIVEYGETNKIFNQSYHPYTKALLSAVPGSAKEKRIVLEGDVPSGISPPEGCYFHPRCKDFSPPCENWNYKKTELSKDHEVYCLKAEL